ncbi:MAG: hypothetical protein PHD22_11915, partial [Zoogloea sp.]|nr:hypothetical protein [Zoogloea sp.]
VPESNAVQSTAEGEAANERRRSRRGRRGGRRNEEPGSTDASSQGELEIGEQSNAATEAAPGPVVASTPEAAVISDPVVVTDAANSTPLETTTPVADTPAPADAPPAPPASKADTPDLIEQAVQTAGHPSVIESPAAIQPGTGTPDNPAEPAAVPQETPADDVGSASTLAATPVTEIAAAPLEPLAAPIVDKHVVEVMVPPQENISAEIRPEPAPVAATSTPLAAPADLEASGLVLIETRRDTAQAFAPVEAPVQPLGRRRRSAQAVAEEPLVQVETGQK